MVEPQAPPSTSSASFRISDRYHRARPQGERLSGGGLTVFAEMRTWGFEANSRPPRQSASFATKN